MAAQTLEQKKQLYSRQLAAHTFRQWNAVRQNQPREKEDEDEPGFEGSDIHVESQLGSGNDQPTHTLGMQRRNRDHVNGKVVHVVDYGLTLRREGEVS